MRDVDDRGATRLDGFDLSEKGALFQPPSTFLGRLIEHEHPGRCASAFAISDELPLSHAWGKSLTRVRLSKSAPIAASCSPIQALSLTPSGLPCPRHAGKKVPWRR